MLTRLDFLLPLKCEYDWISRFRLFLLESWLPPSFRPKIGQFEGHGEGSAYQSVRGAIQDGNASLPGKVASTSTVPGSRMVIFSTISERARETALEPGSISPEKLGSAPLCESCKTVFKNQLLRRRRFKVFTFPFNSSNSMNAGRVTLCNNRCVNTSGWGARHESSRRILPCSTMEVRV